MIFLIINFNQLLLQLSTTLYQFRLIVIQLIGNKGYRLVSVFGVQAYLFNGLTSFPAFFLICLTSLCYD